MTTESAIIQTPFTKMQLVFESGSLQRIDFVSQLKLSPPVSAEARNASQQVQDYCSKQLANLQFDIELDIKGTPFQKKVWTALQQIPAGKVVTYGELAQQLKTSARAVGNACRANPVPLVIPCHRVVARSGMGGYAGSRDGSPLKIKAWLLEHEGVFL